MSMSGRDKKIIFAIVPLLVIGAFWFLLFAPQREEASKAASALAKQEKRLGKAKAQAAAAESSEQTFASDYTTLVKLGKAVPSRLDMPSVIVQLELAAKGTGISFTKIATGERKETPATTAQPPAAPGKGNGSQPAAAGGAPAQSAPGGAVESAGNGVNSANNTTASAEKSGVNPADTQTSTTAGGAGTAGAAASGAPGLDSVPLDLKFEGSFFRLADFFHSLKRFVRVANENISVRGRLLTIDGLHFKSDPELFPRLDAEIKATVYLAPESQGATAGATPNGPASPAPPAGTPASNGNTAPNPTAAAPAATP